MSYLDWYFAIGAVLVILSAILASDKEVHEMYRSMKIIAVILICIIFWPLVYGYRLWRVAR